MADDQIHRTVDTSDKLRIINEALINTGNNPVSAIDDTSDEWIAANSAFEQWVPILLHRRNWNFATRIVVLTRLGDSSFPGYADVFAKPTDCLFLETVYRADVAAMILPDPGIGISRQDIRTPPLQYKIVGDDIHCVAPQGASALYVPFPIGSQPWSIGFVATLRFHIEAVIYRAINKDMAASYQATRFAETALAEAASRCSQEEPRKALMRSRAVAARRTRKF